MKPFRFGVSVRDSESRADWAGRARKIEDLGFAVLTVPDHLANMLAPIPALVSAAEATTGLRVGPLVLNNDLRHPVLVAREAATLDLLTDGRLELGLGAGHMKVEYDQAGLTFDPGRVRIERLAEAVGLVKRLLAGEPVTFVGRHYRVTNHTSYPRPVQRPHPPILIGGQAPPLLALAAAEADIVGLTGIAFRRGGAEPDVAGFTPASVDRQVQLVRQGAGDRYERIELSALVQRVVVTDDRQRAAEDLARRWPRLAPEAMLETPHVLIGSVDGLVDALLGYRQRWGISYYTIFEAFVDAFAPVVARLAGR